MYQNEISELRKLKDERYENIFQIYQDENSRYYYNLLETINFPDNLPEGFFNDYVIQPGDTLPFISFKLFNTIHVWWVICLANKINDPTKELIPGEVLRVPLINIVREIIRQVNTQ